MRKMPGLDPTTLPAANTNSPIIGVGTPFNSGLTTACGALYFKNKSNVGVNIVFDDGTSAEIPAWHARLFQMQRRINQLWLSQAYMLNIAKSPISQLDYEAYQANEDTTGLYTGPINYRTTIGNQLGLGQTFDAILEAEPSVAVNTFSAQIFALTAFGLSIASVSPTNPGYLVLGYLDCDGGRSTFKDVRGNKESVQQSFTITVPGNVTGNQQQVLFAPANYFKGLIWPTGAIPSGVTITKVEFKKSQDPVANYIDTIQTSFGGQGHIDIGNFFDGQDGFTNLISQGAGSGFNVRLTINNTNAGSQNITMIACGSQIAYDEAKILVSYQDWQNNIYDLGAITIGHLKTLPLNFLVPIPITSPSQTNFGNIIFTVLADQLFYNTAYTLDTEIPCYVSFLSPE